jgi:hypothetical protein
MNKKKKEIVIYIVYSDVGSGNAFTGVVSVFDKKEYAEKCVKRYTIGNPIIYQRVLNLGTSKRNPLALEHYDW